MGDTAQKRLHLFRDGFGQVVMGCHGSHALFCSEFSIAKAMGLDTLEWRSAPSPMYALFGLSKKPRRHRAPARSQTHLLVLLEGCCNRLRLLRRAPGTRPSIRSGHPVRAHAFEFHPQAQKETSLPL